MHHSGADPGVEGGGRRAGGDLWLYHRPCLGRYGGHCMVGRLDRDHPAVVVARPQEGGVAGGLGGRWGCCGCCCTPGLGLALPGCAAAAAAVTAAAVALGLHWRGDCGLRHRVSGHSGGQPVDIDTVGDLVEAD